MSSQIPAAKATSDSGFLQEPPCLGNQYDDDLVFQNILKRLLPPAVLEQIKPDLRRFGDRVVKDIAVMADDVENPQHYPRLRQYDAWCRRVDEISVANGWKQLNDVAAEEGLVAIGYERQFNEHSRLYQFAKQYLYAPSSAMYSCPLSMTDGAARVIELLGTEEMKANYYKRLTSRDAKLFWTSGQWMTERPGGSDVGNSETQAELVDQEKNLWKVSGFKWFSSATTADMTMLLARTIDPKTGLVQKGSKGLSLYVAEMRKPDGQLNGVRVHRLKDKYGTKGLPTAELQLSGMDAQLLGNPGRGVPNIASILNITRIYACMGVVAALRRSLAIAKDYAFKRQAFSRTLDKVPLHITTLAQLELVFRAGAQIVFYEIQLLGRTECLKDRTEDVQMLRFLTPIAKAYVCKIGVNACSEAMEALGGQGYMEEIGIGRQLRDAQVNTIWEGTTNVLAMDVVRVLRETKGAALETFEKVLSDKINRAQRSDLRGEPTTHIRHALRNIRHFVTIANPVQLETSARQLTFALGRVLAGVLLLEQAAWAVENNVPGAMEDVSVANLWCSQREFVEEISLTTNDAVLEEAKIVFGSHAKL
ncbi:hypothetical protein DFQ28_009886 [Apophysomyces sp. BC1034]|nr:hypothetical protein DFQ30_009444 [Apophysomyces sp. BC1015]KAG0181584.1 hypothetical protein DFQ29_007844 [Apophysomyces sp. BC1021]KAG0192213.1 hypothetical protein DFQ28_009886 [Apophysomyces sp. BC1034]